MELWWIDRRNNSIKVLLGDEIMSGNTLYIKDNFFSAGQTAVMDEERQLVGSLDLHSMFSSKVSYQPLQSKNLYTAHFTVFSMKWVIELNNQDIGLLRSKLTLFSQKYLYESFGKGTFRIESQAFSKEYSVYNDREELVATFKKINGWFESSAFRLENVTEELTNAELILAIMGVNQIQRKKKARNAGAGN